MAEDGFRLALTDLINRHSKENGSDTPDYILAQFLVGCLLSFDSALQQREKWYGREPISTETNQVHEGRLCEHQAKAWECAVHGCEHFSAETVYNFSELSDADSGINIVTGEPDEQ